MSSKVRASPAFQQVVQQLKAVAESSLAYQQQVAQSNAKTLKASTDFTLPLNLRHTENVADALESVDAKHHEAFSTFIKNQHEYKELLIRYQGVDVDSPERVQMSANRVGLELPEIK